MANRRCVKVDSKFFSDLKVKQIQGMPRGAEYLLIWLKLLCLANEIDDNGLLYLTKDVPYTEKMLGNEFGYTAKTIRNALEIFKKFGMIGEKNGFFFILNFENSEKFEENFVEKIREGNRIRSKKRREKLKNLSENGEKKVCSYCGEEATGYDHVVPISKGGTNDDWNLVPCCKACNTIKNNQPLVEFLNANRDRVNDNLVAANETLQKYVTLNHAENRYVSLFANDEKTDSNEKRVTEKVTENVTQDSSEDGQTEKQEKEKNQKKENKENPLIENQYVEDIDKDINVNNGTTVKDRTIVEEDNIYNIYIKDKGEEETGKTDIPVSEVAVEKSGESVAWSKSSNRANFARLLEKSDSEVFDALRADTPLCDTIRMWLEYKDAKHDYYKNEMSLTTLCKKFVRKNAEVGHEVLLDGVETAISNCWKGIIWDRMTVEKRPVNRVAQELDDFYKRAAAWASREDDDNDFFMGGAF